MHGRPRREAQAKDKGQKIALAAEETKEAELAITEVEGILGASLKEARAIDWEGLKDRSAFTVAKPTPPEKPAFPEKPDQSSIPLKPDPKNPLYQPKHSLLSSLVPGRKEREIEEAIGRYHADVEARKAAIRNYNESVLRYNRQVADLKKDYKLRLELFNQQLEAWESSRVLFEAKQAKQHEDVDNRKHAYLSLDPSGVLDFCEIVLTSSVYPGFCPRSFDFDYVAETKSLIIDHALPRLDDLPSRKAAKYVQSQDKIVYTSISD